MAMSGRASHVTDLGDGTVLRVGGDPSREARLMALAGASGVRVPRVMAARADGLVLERVPGPTMAARLLRRPWEAGRQVRILAALHEQVHGVALDDAWLVHRDLHPENVLLSPSGAVLIDWTNAGAGDPAMDVALTWLIMETSAGMPGRLLARLFRRRVGSAIIRDGLEAAIGYRLADPNVSEGERARVQVVELG
jgi:aminoglycoside/choline kinase family phosphotransferase